jgi:hypothetical protein
MSRPPTNPLKWQKRNKRRHKFARIKIMRGIIQQTGKAANLEHQDTEGRVGITPQSRDPGQSTMPYVGCLALQTPHKAQQ